jgi:hypothetical protein
MGRNIFLSGIMAGLILLPHGASGRNLPAGYHPYYATDFASGLASCMAKQGNVSVVPAPGGISGKVLKVHLSKSDNFHTAGIDLGQCWKIQPGREYMIMWSAYIPADTLVDTRQSDGMIEIQSGNASQPFRLSLDGDRYVVDIGNGDVSKRHEAGPAGGMGKQSGDKGYWVRWTLHYLPDANGKSGITELYKNSTLVLAANGEPNAVLDKDDSYLRIGISRPQWKDKPSNVSRRTMYFGDITVGIKS